MHMLKKMKLPVLVPLLVVIIGLFVYGFGFFGASVNAVILAAVLCAGAVMIFNLTRKKTPVEKFYEKVNLQYNGKFMKFIEERDVKKGTAYSYEIPLGLTKQDYQKYQQALEQYLKKNVEYSFLDHLIITILDGPLEKYK